MVEYCPVSLNIKNEAAHRLARRLADLTGESMTTVVTQALAEKLERIEGPGPERGQRAILGLAAQSAPLLEGHELDHGRLLYDEQGLPR